MGYFKTVDRTRESGTGNQFLVPYLGIYYQCFKSAYREYGTSFLTIIGFILVSGFAYITSTYGIK